MKTNANEARLLTPKGSDNIAQGEALGSGGVGFAP
jgi:hypothetical protein